MNIALLFNCAVPEYNGVYRLPIHNKVFMPGIIQASGRHMKVWTGDVSTYSHSREHSNELCEHVYFAHTWARLHEARLRATFWGATVYALVFENLTKEIANNLHETLTPDHSYLGLQAVDYAYVPHLVVYRNSLIPAYRLQGPFCSVFYFIGQQFQRNDDDFSQMCKIGYDVTWENRGAHSTYFDDYNTSEHFQQVENFRIAVAPYMSNGENDADELVMLLEDLNPALFNALGAAVDVLRRARTEEHVAQVALSGRRYLEQLADVLFPAQEKEHNERKVGRAEFKNRIWAFIADNVSCSDDTLLRNLGRQTDRLVEEFNACLHGDQPQDRVLRALANTAELTAALLALNPAGTRMPYFAFRKRIAKFLKQED
jgi:hypothetical protein